MENKKRIEWTLDFSGNGIELKVSGFTEGEMKNSRRNIFSKKFQISGMSLGSWANQKTNQTRLLTRW